jgi:osmoprotectant transport system substrate-binding protein
MKKTSRKSKTMIARLLTIAAAVALAATAASCGEKKNSPAVRIGSKDFTENLILAELYALALEDAGIPVKRKFALASSVVHTTLVNNEIDLYPEYTGTGLLSVLKRGLETDPQKVYRIVKDQYKQKFNLVWLDYAPANDGQGLAIAKRAADEYGIRTISDLQRNAEKIRFASQGEFDAREDALPLLIKVYGPFNWKSSVVYSNALKYQVLLQNEADAAPAYTTEGQLAGGDVVPLIDDKAAWPPYNIAPVLRQEILEKYPNIAEILNRVNAKIDTPSITALNAQVDLDKEEYEDVAKAFFNRIKK